MRQTHAPWTLFPVLLSVLLCCLTAQAQQHFQPPGIAASPAPPPPPAAEPTPAPGVVLPRNWRMAPAATESDLPAKLRYYVRSTWSIRNLLEAMAVAGVPNITSAPPQPRTADFADPYRYELAMDAYGDAMDNWRRVNEQTLRYHADRFEVGLATAETRQLLSNLVLPVALHQQARYLPAPIDAGFGERMANAVESIVVTRNDEGFRVPNYSKLGGTVAAAFLGKAVYADAFNAPELNSGHFVFHSIGYSLLGDLATNVAHEIVRSAMAPDEEMYALHGPATEDSYYPLSLGGKFVYWARNAYAPRNYIEGALIAGMPTIRDRPDEPVGGQPSTWSGYPDYDAAYENYGDTILHWKDTLEENVRYHGRRLAGGLSESETQLFLQNLAIPVALDMDPRYIPLGSGYSGGQRFAHALTSLVMTHTDTGNRTLNLPVLGGTVGAAFIAKELYYPQLDTPALASNGVLAKTITLNVAADAIYNVIGEFLRHRSY